MEHWPSHVLAMRSLFTESLYYLRDLRSASLFRALRRHCHGEVLDVGGWDFYRSALAKRVCFDKWIVLETSKQSVTDLDDKRVSIVVGDGCQMGFADNSFDTVLSIQVLEHVFEPNQMMSEMCRVLRPGGYLVMLVPQTSSLHMLPHHYYNFTRYWVQEAACRNGIEIIRLEPLGGVWASVASNLVYAVFQGFRVSGFTSSDFVRPFLFYCLFPFMLCSLLFFLPICMLFSLGDLTEAPNNHLVVARKP